MWKRKISACVCTSMHVFVVGVHMYVDSCVTVYGEARDQRQLSFQVLSTSFCETGSFSSRKLTDLWGWLVNKPKILAHLCFSSIGIIRTCYHVWLLKYSFWGSTQVLMLAWQALYQPSYCPRQPRKVLETEQSKLFRGSMKEKEIRKEVIR